MSIRTILRVAEAEIGYLEKASNKDLDSKTKNAGRGNYTKYWRDMKPGYQGEPWCNAFVNWVFVQAYGKANALRLLCCKDFDYYTPTTAGFFKEAGRWGKAPQVGAVIYFRGSERIHHVGIVVSFTKDSVTTIEGNTSSGKKVVANGGGVWSKTYSRSNTAIAGYGLPDYAAIPMPFIDRVYLKALGRTGDAAGRSHWINGCATGAVTGTDVVRGFYLGPEYRARRRSNTEFISDLYEGLFDRPGDEAGKKYWMTQLNTDKMTRTEVAEGFALSEEYAGVCRSYGIDRGKW